MTKPRICSRRSIPTQNPGKIQSFLDFFRQNRNNYSFLKKSCGPAPSGSTGFYGDFASHNELFCKIWVKKSLFIFWLSAACLISCNSCSDKKPVTDADIQKAQQNLIKENKKQHEQEMKNIADFIKKKKWPMKETETGLQYWIYENGTGDAIKLDDIVSVSYSISLLDDTPCYTTTDAQPKQIHVGQDNVETGLHEALQYLHAGDRARIILPSHLAFGFTGDSGKIPQNASVVYDMHVVRVN